MLADWLCPKICVDGVRRVNRPLMGRIGRIHTDLIRADPSDPPNPWSISPPNLASCLSQLDSNTQIGHYPTEGSVLRIGSILLSGLTGLHFDGSPRDRGSPAAP